MLAGCGSQVLCSDRYPSDRDMLEEAKRNLLRCKEFGTLSKFNELIVRMNHVMHLNINSFTIQTEARDNMPLEWKHDVSGHSKKIRNGKFRL